MDLDLRLDVPGEVNRALMPLLNKEAAKALSQTGRKLISREQLLLKHWQDGQGEWDDQSTEYAKRKQREHGTTDHWVRTGDTKKKLTSENDQVWMRTSTAKRTVKIGLKKLSADGTNIAPVLQRGRFKGVASDLGASLSKRETWDLNSIRAAQKNGAMGNLGRKEMSGMSAGMRKTLSALQGGESVQFSRNSQGPMPITAILPGDEPVIVNVLTEEVEITMKLRGF